MQPWKDYWVEARMPKTIESTFVRRPLSAERQVKGPALVQSFG
jgi:hypothetical protein